MTASTAPVAGLIGLSAVHGTVGRLIQFGEFLNGDGFRKWEHAFVSIGGGLIVEAEPGGARVAHASDYATVYWCNNIAALHTPAQLQAVADAAKMYVGVPYSFLDYDALFCHRLHIPAPGLQGYIADTHHMICSQLADQAEQDAGMHLYKDGRWPGYVTPADLYNLDVSLEKRSA